MDLIFKKQYLKFKTNFKCFFSKAFDEYDYEDSGEEGLEGNDLGKTSMIYWTYKFLICLWQDGNQFNFFKILDEDVPEDYIDMAAAK